MKSISETFSTQLQGTTKILQVVTAAMTAGSFMGLVVVLGLSWDNLTNEPKLLVLLGAFTGMVMFGLSWLIASVFNQPIIADDTPTEAQEKQATEKVTSTHIIRSAIIEGAVMLNLMVLLLERNFISVAVAALGILLLCSLFPTHRKVVRAVERRLK